MPRGFEVLDPAPNFDLNCALIDPVRVAEDLPRLLERPKGDKSLPMNASQAKPTLDEIGLRHRTDKASSHHNFLVFYDRFFSALRDMPGVKLLEIGIYDGASIRTWEDYFPHASIVGADIDPRTLESASARTTVEIIDQSNIADLTRLATTHGPFDVVLDDGSHHWDHQITSFRTLYPFVKPGGYYVMEDIDTSYGSYAETFKVTGPIPAAKYLHLLLDYLVGDAALDISKEPDAFIRSYARLTEFVAFYRRTAVIRKKEA